MTLKYASLTAILWTAAVSLGQPPTGAKAVPVLTHGVASGDISRSTAIVWARADREAMMTVRYYPVLGVSEAHQVEAKATSGSHFASQVTLTNLRSATRYRYEVWFQNAAGRSATDAGTFLTAPEETSRAPVSIIWGGDVGGQGYCRQTTGGYGIFNVMAAARPDFFVANGDMIYADGECPAKGPQPDWSNIPGDFPSISSAAVDWQDRARVDDVFAAHWLYNRSDPAFQDFLRATPMYTQWDDHEVINDFGARWPAYAPTPERAGYANIVAAGRKTFFDFHPIERHASEPERIYRAYRWGRDVEVFILDARSYRSENAREDTVENGKTMLGLAQLDWLKDRLTRSTATWKIISSDVPLSVPTGTRPDVAGRDAFANGDQSDRSARTGFERELFDLLRSLDAANVSNVVFVATDVHFAAQLKYERDIDGDGDLFLFHEFLSGPLSAGRTAKPPPFDATHGPLVLYVEGNIFNFGTLKIGNGSPDRPSLWTDIRDENGRVRPGSARVIAPQGTDGR